MGLFTYLSHGTKGPASTGNLFIFQQAEAVHWGQDEAARPTFAQVITRLRKLLHGETERLRRSKSKGAGSATPVGDTQERPPETPQQVGKLLHAVFESKQCCKVATVLDGGGLAN